jgi:hypothetical protein
MATAGASGVLKGALYGTGKLPKNGTVERGMTGSVSLPTLLPSVAAAAKPSLSAPRAQLPGVVMETLFKFLYPARLENPDSCGRLEIFGKFGPTDEDGNLRGGQNGAHIHMDCEVNQMVKHNCRESLYDLFLPKDRSTVESIVDTLMPNAMAHRYSHEEVKHLLKNVPRYPGTGRMIFTDLQETIKAIQKKRLGEMATRAMSGKPIAPPKERPIKQPYQSKPCYALHAVTRKKKHLPQEEEISKTKRMHSYSTLVASLEDQTMSEQVQMNSIMCRDLGRLDDRWDRYCALRRTGRSSYVQTRNTYRFNPAMDCGLGNKHPCVSSLLVASAAGSSAAAMLGAS